MLTLEVFTSSLCVSGPSARAVAEKAVSKVGGVRLIYRSEEMDQSRARTLGVFIYPSFVLDGVICVVGEPEMNDLVHLMKKKLTIQ